MASLSKRIKFSVYNVELDPTKKSIQIPRRNRYDTCI